MNRFRNSLRRLARGDHWFGFGCTVLVHLLRGGPRAAGRVIRDRRRRNRERRSALRLIRLPEEELRRQREASAGRTMLISVAVPLYNTPAAFLREMIDSVRAQTWPRWELCLADGSGEDHPEVGRICREYAEKDSRIRYRKLEKNGGISENTNACLRMAGGEYVALLDHDDLLLPNALYEAARAVAETGADFLYSDEYLFVSPDPRAILVPHLKPDFAPETLLANNYICHLSVFSRTLYEQAGGFRKEYDGSQDHDLILRLTDRAERVAHIPKPLYLWRSHADSVAADIGAKAYAIGAGRRAVRDFLASKGLRTEVDSVEACPTMYRIRYPAVGEPSVCVVLDCFGSPKPAEALAEQIRDLTARAGWRRVSFAVVTRRPVSGTQAAPVRWFVSGEENRAARLNRVIRETESDYIVLLDPDLRPVSDRWLPELLTLAQQEPAGAVGGKVVFRNGRIRHAGLAIGLGRQRLAGRLFFGASEPGYFGQLAVMQNLSAVSSECLMVSRQKYEQAGGFPEAYRNGLFDVDFCLTLSALGYRNVFCPFCLFAGGEKRRFSLDYGAERTGYAEDAELFRTRQAERLRVPDPFFHPALSRDHGDFRIRRE